MARRFAMTFCFLALWLTTAFAAQHSHTTSDSQVMHAHHPTGEANGSPATITGYVRDIACLLRNPKSGAATTPLTEDCMQKCIRGGSPIGILTENGELYTPMSDVIPDKAVRSGLLPYVGKYIRATGRVFERGGLHAITLESIQIVSRPADSHIPTL